MEEKDIKSVIALIELSKVSQNWPSEARKIFLEYASLQIAAGLHDQMWPAPWANWGGWPLWLKSDKVLARRQ